MFDEVILTDILAQETEHKDATFTQMDVQQHEPAPVSQPTAPLVQAEPEKDPEQSAEAIIDMINLANKSVFMPLLAWKAKKKIPKDVFNIISYLENLLPQILNKKITSRKA